MDESQQFTHELRQVLSHLYDSAYLQNHAFLRWFGELRQPGVSRSQAQRRLILEAIEQLNPGPRFSPRSPEARSYQILALRFVEGKSPQEVSLDLAITQRQLFRDQQVALKALASILREQRPGAAAPLPARNERESLLRDEVQRADDDSDYQPIDLCELVRAALDLVAPLVGRLPSGRFVLDCPTAPLVINTNRTLLRQAVLQALHALLSCRDLLSLRLQLAMSDPTVRLSLSAVVADPQRFSSQVDEHLSVIGRILQPLRGSVALTPRSDGLFCLDLDLPVDRPAVLIVEDNQDAVQLVQRYLADQPCRVVSASSAAEGLHLARTLHPAVVVVDLMMPGQDGWELLQNLRADPLTAPVPVVVCSVLPQESLARSLGAVGYLRKPFAREALLAVLNPLLTSHRARPS